MTVTAIWDYFLVATMLLIMDVAKFASLTVIANLQISDHVGASTMQFPSPISDGKMLSQD